MKKLLVIILTVTLFYPAYSQTCNPVWTESGYGIIPDTVTNLPPAYEGRPYSTTIVFKIPPDSMVGIGIVKTKVIIYHLRIDSTFGMEQIPSIVPFQGIANPSSAVFKGDSTGCIAITGTPAIGSAGIYTLTVYFTASVYVTLFKSDYEQHYQSQGYRITVLPDTVTTSIARNELSIGEIFPNPSCNKFHVQYFTPHAESVNLKVYSLLGKLVIDNNLNSTAGFNSYDLFGEDIPAGEYFCALSSGNKRVIQRIVRINPSSR